MHGGAERRRAPLLTNVSPRAPRRFDPPYSYSWSSQAPQPLRAKVSARGDRALRASPCAAARRRYSDERARNRPALPHFQKIARKKRRARTYLRRRVGRRHRLRPRAPACATPAPRATGALLRLLDPGHPPARTRWLSVHLSSRTHALSSLDDRLRCAARRCCSTMGEFHSRSAAVHPWGLGAHAPMGEVPQQFLSTRLDDVDVERAPSSVPATAP